MFACWIFDTTPLFPASSLSSLGSRSKKFAKIMLSAEIKIRRYFKASRNQYEFLRYEIVLRVADISCSLQDRTSSISYYHTLTRTTEWNSKLRCFSFWKWTSWFLAETPQSSSQIFRDWLALFLAFTPYFVNSPRK